jgi:hypothetical protein
VGTRYSPSVLLVRASGGRRATLARRTSWIFGCRADLVISLCWIPLWFAGHRLAAGHGPHDDALLRSAVAATLLVSFLHQPLTLGLVYGDAKQFGQRRRLFLWAPPLAVAVTVTAVILHLWIVIPIAAVWNTVHTLQQRYGLARIYGRKAGYGSAQLDRWVLYAWMGAAVLAVAAKPGVPGLVRRASLDGVNAGGIRLLTDARPWALTLLVPAVLLALGLAAAIVVQEVGQAARASDPAVVEGLHDQAGSATDSGGQVRPVNPAKWLYQASSLLLIASIAVDPAAGFIAYVGSHAIEYFVVVYKTTETRYGRTHDRSTVLGRAAFHPAGRVACFSGVIGAAVLTHTRLGGSPYTVVLYSVGVLHFLYDGVIWKLRKPAVAADFAIRPAGVGH